MPSCEANDRLQQFEMRAATPAKQFGDFSAHRGLDGMPVTRPVDEVAADPDMPDPMEVERTEHLAQEVKEINLAEEEPPNKEVEQARTILTDLAAGSEQMAMNAIYLRGGRHER